MSRVVPGAPGRAVNVGGLPGRLVAMADGEAPWAVSPVGWMTAARQLRRLPGGGGVPLRCVRVLRGHGRGNVRAWLRFGYRA